MTRLAVLLACSAVLAFSQGRPRIQTESVPDGRVGTLYGTNFDADGGSGLLTWQVTEGTLPPGLLLIGLTGTLTGIPTAAGEYTFTLTVRDSSDRTDTETFRLRILSATPPSIQTSTLPGGTAGTAYSATLSAAGGAPPYSWSVAGGTLPAGLNLSSAGAITGNAATAGTFNFSARVTDSVDQSATRDLQIIISTAPNPPTISTSTLPGGTVGAPYSGELRATGGTPPYTWTISSGSLPGGLSVSVSGALTGAPTGAGTFTFTARVADANSLFATRSLQIVIAPTPVPPTISTSSLPAGTVGTAYSSNLSAAGGTPPYNWAIASGSLPAGLNLSASGAITGTPSAVGTSSFTVRVTDSASQSVTRALEIVIAAAPVPPAITTSSLPGGTVGTTYSGSLSATGGTPPYAWTISSGSLPGGLNLSASGAITGTPTAAGTSAFTVRVTDSANRFATASLQIAIATASVPPTISTSSLPGGTVGTPYSSSLAATGGSPPYSWTVASGSLPAGLNLSGTGAITGTPSAAGTATFTIRATDSASQTSTRDLQIVITAAPTPPVITTSSLAPGTVGAAYSSNLGATGGTPPYSWAVLSGSLPAGLTFNPSGSITGTPSAPGIASFSVRVTDSRSQSAARDLQITVAAAIAPLSISTSSVPNAIVASEYSQTLLAAGGRAPYSWSIASGTLPPGLSLTAAGVISGTPSTVGSFSFTTRASDADARTAERPFSITVAAALAIQGCPEPTGLVGTNYSAGVSASGGTAPYLWSVTAGQLPPGLSLASPSGLITGSPTLAGPFNFTINVSDSASRSATRNCAITVASPLQILTEVLPDGTTTARYAVTLQARGGTAPFTWALVGGTLPAGLGLEPVSGVLTGQPTQPGRFTVGIRITDAAGASAERVFNINVATGLTVPSCPSVQAMVGSSYEATLVASGGQAPYVWIVGTGSLPAGLQLSEGGAINGVPTSAGTSNFAIRASDQAGVSAERACSIQVAPELNITTTSLPSGEVGTPYTASLQATGGVPPYNWTISAGSLPNGISFNSTTGQITGTPSAAGVFRLTARVGDLAGNQRERQLELTVGGGFVITACPSPTAIVGEAYSASPSLSGGQAPATWSLASGVLPTGLTLSPSSGVINGTATVLGTTDFTLRATDAATRTTTRACSINVNPSALRISASGQLSDSLLGVAYTQALQAGGGRAPYTWSLIDGSLPPGIVLSPTGAFSGIPSVLGVYRFTIRATDADRSVASAVLELRVIPARSPNVSFGDLPDIVAPAQQPRVMVTIDEPYPVALTGTLLLQFTPDPGLNVDDPSVTFVNGSRSISFEIPANATEAIFPVPQNALQTGSVAGVINLEANLSAGAIDVTPLPRPTKAMRVDRTAPVITNLRINPVSGGFEVLVTGLSTTREVITATFQFTPASGSQVQQSQVTVQTEAAARAWFADTRSAQYGGQFTFTQPFTVQNATLSEVTVTLTNGQGTSQPARVRF